MRVEIEQDARLKSPEITIRCPAIDEDILRIVAMLLLSTTGTFVQYLCFTDNIIKNMRYTRRLMLFGALFLPLLTGIAVAFGWFPAAKPGAWALFLGIALVVFAAMTLGFEMYFRVAGRKYDGLLGQYRKEHEGE